ncbi:MAG: hypothetical protein K8R36_12545 [Planctomycetales bacterium]|nr:hypothetical protein [Planctomycetales bacterium]
MIGPVAMLVNGCQSTEKAMNFPLSFSMKSLPVGQVGECKVDEYEAVTKRLLNHAGLPDARNEKELRNRSLSYQLYVADRERTRPDLALLDDVVDCLAVLNNCVNGPDPDARPPGPRKQPVPDEVAYSIACILTASLEYYRKWSVGQRFSDDVLTTLLIGIHKISFCWMQLLAGDITNLAEGFEYR